MNLIQNEGKSIYEPLACAEPPGGDSHIKVTGVLVGFFESDP